MDSYTLVSLLHSMVNCYMNMEGMLNILHYAGNHISFHRGFKNTIILPL